MKDNSIKYAVVHKSTIRTASVLLMSDNRRGAINLWEHWNDGIKFSDVNKKEGWTVKKYTVTLR